MTQEQVIAELGLNAARYMLAVNQAYVRIGKPAMANYAESLRRQILIMTREE